MQIQDWGAGSLQKPPGIQAPFLLESIFTAKRDDVLF